MGKIIFKIAMFAKRPGLLRAYRDAVRQQRWSRTMLESYQEKRLQDMILFCAKHVPYYQSLFANNNIDWRTIQRLADLAELPTLNKSQIRAAGEDIFPTISIPYSVGSTGGSTGEPLRYRVSREDGNWGMANLFRGWGYAGYELGEPMAVVAGASLTARSPGVKDRLSDFILNTKHYSSYGMSDEKIESYLLDINEGKYKYLRGYATSLYELASKALAEGQSFPAIHAVFSTAERLTSGHRSLIEEAFGAKVFDNYGLNDGGVTAFECGEGRGMHVDYSRSILEVVGEDDAPILNGKGRILATSLRNKAMPFIRYETGDLAEISDEPCPCGRPGPLLTAIQGRETERLEINGQTIGSPVLTVLMGRVPVREYQIRQTGSDSLVIDLIPLETYNKHHTSFIQESIMTHVSGVKIVVNIVERIHRNVDSKHKFIFKDF